jgi:tetratricopeptide (TPR) repeat protein
LQSRKLAEQAENYAWKGNLQKALQKLDALARADPIMAIGEYVVAANILTEAGKTNQALQVYENAMGLFTSAQYEVQMLFLRYRYMMLLKESGKNQQAVEQLNIVEKSCRQRLDENPSAVEPYVLLGNMEAENGDFVKAAEYFQKAVELQPDNSENYLNLMLALQAGGKLDSAIETARKAIKYFEARNRSQDAEYLTNQLDSLLAEKSSNP